MNEHKLTDEEYETLFPRANEDEDVRLRCGCMVDLCLAPVGGDYTEDGYKEGPVGAISGTITKTCEIHLEY
jgi:hypothetical protein